MCISWMHWIGTQNVHTHTESALTDKNNNNALAEWRGIGAIFRGRWTIFHCSELWSLSCNWRALMRAVYNLQCFCFQTTIPYIREVCSCVFYRDPKAKITIRLLFGIVCKCFAKKIVSEIVSHTRTIYVRE